MNKHRRMLLDEEMKKELEEATETFERFIDLIDGCSSKIMEMSYMEIADGLFDGPIYDVHHCIYGGGLNDAKDKLLITEYVYQKANELAELVMPMWNTDKWTVESVRQDKEWLEVMKLADHIKTLL